MFFSFDASGLFLKCDLGMEECSVVAFFVLLGGVNFETTD